ncbi:hypothetical protein G2W53_004870 [Senna tora]|uniref:Uncharacterized protein n=1 Tax=Senna tora TaxID=362788 RepID=A0A834XE30_9FABA|nr:hypothetical protein G2W53_004870 [Senna tora]
MAWIPTNSTAFGTPTLRSNTLPISPAIIAGTAYSVKLTVIPPSSPFLNTALLPVKSSSKTTPNPYTSLFVVSHSSCGFNCTLFLGSHDVLLRFA